MKRTAVPLTAAAILLAGCGSLGSSPAAPPQGSPAAAVSSSAAPCTTDKCLAGDMQTLVGTVDKEDSVMTKLACKASTVKRKTAGIWTMTCTVTYSDGTVARGVGTVDEAQDEVTFEPETIVSGSS